MSQPAISQHLGVLRRAKLVQERKDGRNRLYQVNPGSLEPAQQWLDEHTAFWATRFDRLGAHLRKRHGRKDKV